MVRGKLIARLRAVVLAGLATVGAAGGAHAAEIADAVHMGVASCASSVCHGRATQSATNRVWMTEYRVWQGSDPHATAYATLLTEQSRRMAERLGIGEAHKAAVCLDCHADNVPAEKQGARFSLADGIGCEACHGGAEQWLASHADSSASHADNLAAGMYPTADPRARAQLCQSCHQGTPDKFASHDIMAAGHPQLLFELSTFSALQPMHYAIDDDYRARKGDHGPVDFWLQGLAASASASLDLIVGKQLERARAFPEISLYYCDSCHRSTAKDSGPVRGFVAQLPSGSIPLNDSSLRLLMVVARALGIEGVASAARGIDQLARSGSLDHAGVSAHAMALKPWLAEVSAAVVAAADAGVDLAPVRRALLTFASAGEARYFPLAFQVYLGVGIVDAELGDGALPESAMQGWFGSVATEAAFDPQGFAAGAQGLRNRLP